MFNPELLLRYLNTVTPAQLYQTLIDLEPKLTEAQVHAFYKASYEGMQRRRSSVSPKVQHYSQTPNR